MQVHIETLRKTLGEAATACNEELPPRIKSSGGVCHVSMEVGAIDDKMRVTLTVGGDHHTVEVSDFIPTDAADLIRMAVNCVGLLEDWFDVTRNTTRGIGPGVRLRG